MLAEDGNDSYYFCVPAGVSDVLLLLILVEVMDALHLLLLIVAEVMDALHR